MGPKRIKEPLWSLEGLNSWKSSKGWNHWMTPLRMCWTLHKSTFNSFGFVKLLCFSFKFFCTNDCFTTIWITRWLLPAYSSPFSLKQNETAFSIEIEHIVHSTERNWNQSSITPLVVDLSRAKSSDLRVLYQLSWLNLYLVCSKTCFRIGPIFFQKRVRLLTSIITKNNVLIKSLGLCYSCKYWMVTSASCIPNLQLMKLSVAVTNYLNENGVSGSKAHLERHVT